MKFYKNNSQILGILFSITILVSVALPTTAITLYHPLVNNETTETQITGPPMPIEGFEIMLEEDFTDGNIPPIDPYQGQWTHLNTSNNETWHIDPSQPYSEPNCSTVHRGNYRGLQNECLITPVLDFSNYQEIYLRFRWFTSQLTAQEKDVLDLNVSITIDNQQTWTQIWNEDNEPVFVSWTWQYTTPIDLSTYAGETQVQIRFQYYSNNNTDAYLQEFSIDDIVLYGNSTTFWCTTGGTYQISWSWNKINGIKFHGNAGEGQPPYFNWTWDFGDGHTSKIPYSPTHSYGDRGIYNVSLIVTDSANPKHIAFDNTTVEVIETPPPEIDINVQTPSIGIKAELENTGLLNISHIDWTMTVEWGPLKVFDRKIANDTITNIEAKNSITIQSAPYFFAFGFIRIIITVEPLNSHRNEIQVDALKLGPFIFGAH